MLRSSSIVRSQLPSPRSRPPTRAYSQALPWSERVHRTKRALSAIRTSFSSTAPSKRLLVASGITFG